MKQERSGPRLRFTTRVLLLQLAVVAAVVLIAAGTFAALTYQWLGEQAEERALSVARTVASSEDVRRETAALAAGPESALTPANLAGGPLQENAEAVRVRTDALFVVVTDDAGLRLAHPNPDLLGQKVSTDPSVALGGGEETSQEHGTLGRSARAKVPVYAPGPIPGAAVVGEVSVGFASDDVFAGMLRNIPPVALIAGISMALGALASALMGARLRKLTLGLEPEEIAGLAQDQEAVLRGVDEGVIGVSEAGTITVFNDGARRLLAPGSTTDYGGLALAESGLPAFLADAAGTVGAAAASDGGTRRAASDGGTGRAAPGGATGRAGPGGATSDPSAEEGYGPAEHVLDGRVVIVTARPVRLGDSGRGLGRVIMVRDRTEVQALTRQLDAVNALGTALRAQRHEFANRLHTVAGLLDIGRPAEAREFIGEIMDGGPLQYPARDLALLTDPYLEAFIGAKSIDAHERGVEVRIGAGTLVRGRITDPQDVTAVLGNLMDNAIRAAVTGSSPDRWIEVELLDELTETSGTLHLVVADSGDGLASPGSAAPDRELIFAAGYSTAVNRTGATPGTDDTVAGHGVGLALIRHLARRRGGDVWVASDGSPQTHGAVMCARLPGAVAPLHTSKENP